MANDQKVKIRFATVKDVKELIAIDTGYGAIGRKKLFEQTRRKLVFCAEQDRKIVGILYWQPKFLERKNKWYLEQITVVKTMRKRGIGAGLLKHFLAYARSKKVEKIFADVQTWNYASLAMGLRANAILCGYINGIGKKKEGDRVIMRWDFV